MALAQQSVHCHAPMFEPNQEMLRKRAGRGVFEETSACNTMTEAEAAHSIA
jgi:hypothetical protein